MPLYPYTCDKCDHAFDALVKGQPTAVACPACESVATTRGFGVPAKPTAGKESLPMNACGEGPPCGRPACGRIR